MLSVVVPCTAVSRGNCLWLLNGVRTGQIYVRMAAMGQACVCVAKPWSTNAVTDCSSSLQQSALWQLHYTIEKERHTRTEGNIKAMKSRIVRSIHAGQFALQPP